MTEPQKNGYYWIWVDDEWEVGYYDNVFHEYALVGTLEAVDPASLTKEPIKIEEPT